MAYQLTALEANVILHKKTEIPFTGEYWNFFEPGLFACRQCGLPLFDAQSKFEAHCGWPSFDSSFPLAVKRIIDNDGKRTEIVCARCGGHLGHVFTGEKFTDKDTRHCTNSLAIKFVPAPEQDNYLAKAENRLEIATIVVGGGCFWCIEAAMIRIPGILDAVSGYAGGDIANPTYESVCSGSTGYAEVVKLTYDRETVNLEKLLDYFFRIHDPTSLNKQGNDVGTQYRSIICYATESEKKAIAAYLLTKQHSYNSPIVTQVVELSSFYPAEDYHQRYFEKNPYSVYCQAVIRPKINKIK